MCVFFGWRQGSKMPSIYVHLSGRNVDEPLLIHTGLLKKEEVEHPLKPRLCPHCKVLNAQDARYCRRYSLVLDPKEAVKLEERKVEVAGEVEETLKSIQAWMRVMEEKLSALSRF